MHAVNTAKKMQILKKLKSALHFNKQTQEWFRTIDRDCALKCLFLKFQRYSRKISELQYRLNKMLFRLQNDGEGYIS